MNDGRGKRIGRGRRWKGILRTFLNVIDDRKMEVDCLEPGGRSYVRNERNTCEIIKDVKKH